MKKLERLASPISSFAPAAANSHAMQHRVERDKLIAPGSSNFRGQLAYRLPLDHIRPTHAGPDILLCNNQIVVLLSFLYKNIFIVQQVFGIDYLVKSRKFLLVDRNTSTLNELTHLTL